MPNDLKWNTKFQLKLKLSQKPDILPFMVDDRHKEWKLISIFYSNEFTTFASILLIIQQFINFQSFSSSFGKKLKNCEDYISLLRMLSQPTISISDYYQIEVLWRRRERAFMALLLPSRIDIVWCVTRINFNVHCTWSD